MTDPITTTLAERDARYGDYSIHAAASDDIIQTMEAQRNWRRLTQVHRQALRMIGDKIGRILSGDPTYEDNWHDIQGYAKLAEDRCQMGDRPEGQSKLGA